MAGTMALQDLQDDLKASLHDAASLFADDDYAALARLLREALPDLALKRPRTLVGQVTLVADTGQYALTAYPLFAAYKTHLWERRSSAACKPWEPGYPGALPRVTAVQDGSGGGAGWSLCFEPAPTDAHVSAMGATFRFYYFAQHVLDVSAANCTVALADRGLLLLRAQGQAMREVVLHAANKPVQLRDGLSGTPRNSTPAALHEMLLRLFWEAR